MSDDDDDDDDNDGRDEASGVAGDGGTTTSSGASSSMFKLTSSGLSNESSPLTATTSRKKQTSKAMEKKYLERYLEDLEGQKEAFKQHYQQKLTSSTSFWSVFCSQLEVFLANMPLTIGAVGLSWVTLGVIWFKYMEEMISACVPVHYYSNHCTFPEFPGCFACDTQNPTYRLALGWHYACHTVAGCCCGLFLLKIITGGQLVVEELRNPATSTPMGVVCITMVCVFAGRFGFLGEAIVLCTSMAHVALAVWFLYQAVVVYRLYPDPGWFPNTVGLAYAAVKTWLYFPVAGYILLVLCFLFFINLYGITLFRVARNDKIALPVCFIQLSAPSITMYAITLWAQSFPGQDAILNANPLRMTTFVDLHRRFYLPVQHFMLALSLIGMVSILHALYVRWNGFMAKEFSPAHIALVFPILSHTNAIQAYRSGINAYSNIPEGSWFKVCIYVYWVTCLIGGTIFCLCMTYHYVTRLPQWTNLSDDDGASDADEAMSVDFSWMGNYLGDQASLSSALTDAWETGQDGGWELLDDIEDAVNPAVLQANETGVMVRVRRGTADFAKFGPYKRTRRVPSMGFDLTLTDAELATERARHRIHRRATSMSIPPAIVGQGPRHARSRTMA